MIEQNPELEAFSKFIVAIEPWLGEVVLVGGWTHRLYRLDPRARKLDYLPLTTLDGDVAVPPKLKKEESTVTAAGSRLRRRVHRRGSSAGNALSLRKRRRFLRGVSRATRRERIRSERKAEGNEGSGRRFVPVASLYRDFANLSMEGGVRRGKRLCAITEAACTDSQSGELLGTKNPHPRATRLQRQGQRPAVHARYDRGVLGKSGRIAKTLPKPFCAETPCAADSGTARSAGEALRQGR